MGGAKGFGASTGANNSAISNIMGTLFPPEIQAGLSPAQNAAVGSIEQSIGGFLGQPPNNTGTTTITSSGNPSSTTPSRPVSFDIPAGLLSQGAAGRSPGIGGGKG